MNDVDEQKRKKDAYVVKASFLNINSGRKRNILCFDDKSTVSAIK